MDRPDKTSEKLLLHACCGPCSLEPVRLLRAQGWNPTIYYANSNIHPKEEYQHRLTTLKTWAATENVPVVKGVYNPKAWEEGLGRLASQIDENGQRLRCRLCYRQRFQEAAAYGASQGYGLLGTTLSVSPYQYTDIIREELESAAQSQGLEALFCDYRPYYQEATLRSRQLGMYRQNYCGCRYSNAEAAQEREARKRARFEERQRRQESTKAARELEEAARAARKRERAAYDAKQQRKHEILRELRRKDHPKAR